MPKKKLKKYEVIWEESQSIKIKANSQEEAIEIVMSGEFDEKEILKGEIHAIDAFEDKNN